MAVQIRHPGFVSVNPQALTYSPPSKLAAIAGFGHSLASLGNVVAGLFERRKDEKTSSEKAKIDSFLIEYDDILDQTRLQFPADFNAFTKVADERLNHAYKWADGNLSTDKGKAYFASKIEALKNRHQQPILERQSDAIADKRTEDALDAAAKVIPDPQKIGRDLYDGDPAVREAAAQEMVVLRDLFTNPDDTILRSYGPLAAMEGLRTRVKEVDKAAAMAWLQQQSVKDLPSAYATLVTSGAPKGDGSGLSFLATATRAERQEVWNEFVTFRKLAAEAMEQQEDASGDRRDAASQLWMNEGMKMLATGGGVPEEYFGMAPDPTSPKIAELRRAAKEGPWMTAAQRDAEVSAIGYAKARMAVIGTSSPSAKGDLVALSGELMNDPSLHHTTQAEIQGLIDDALVDAEEFVGLTPDQRDTKYFMDAFERMYWDPLNQRAILTGQVLRGAEETRDVLHKMLHDPGIENQAAFDVAKASLRVPLGMRHALVTAFQTPEALAELRERPMQMMALFPTVATEHFQPGPTENSIDYKRTILSMMAAGLDVAAPSPEGEGATLAEEALGVGRGSFHDTIKALDFLEATGAIKMFRDPAVRVRQQEATEILGATTPQGQSPYEAGPTAP